LPTQDERQQLAAHRVTLEAENERERERVLSEATAAHDSRAAELAIETSALEARLRGWESDCAESRRAQAAGEARVKVELAELEQRRIKLNSERMLLAEQQSRFEVRAALLEPQLRELEGSQLVLQAKQQEIGTTAHRTDVEARRLQTTAIELQRREHAVEAALLEVAAVRDSSETATQRAARETAQLRAREADLERARLWLHEQQLELSRQAMAVRRAVGILRRNAPRGQLDAAIEAAIQPPFPQPRSDETAADVPLPPPLPSSLEQQQQQQQHGQLSCDDGPPSHLVMPTSYPPPMQVSAQMLTDQPHPMTAQLPHSQAVPQRQRQDHLPPPPPPMPSMQMQKPPNPHHLQSRAPAARPQQPAPAWDADFVPGGFSKAVRVVTASDWGPVVSSTAAQMRAAAIG
jgi:hypothetical protein